MALIFTDGFDNLTTLSDILQRWDWVGSGTYSSVSTTAGRFGGGVLRTGASSGQASVYKSFPLTGTAVGTDEFFCGFSYAATVGGTGVIAVFQNEAKINSIFGASDTLTNLSLRMNSARQLIVVKANTILATGTTVLGVNQWYRIEVRIVVGNSGLFEVHLNGQPEIAFSGDTYDTGDAGVRQMGFISPFTADNTAVRLDDVVIWNSAAKDAEPTSWLGDLRIETLRPTANGDVINSTPLAGAAYAAVDEIAPDFDTTYTQAAVAGNKDLYQFSDLSETPDVIHGVVVTTVAKSTGTTGRKIKTKVKSGGVEASGSVKNVSLSAYTSLQEAFSRDPATSGAWTPGAVNALQAGWEVDT